MNHLASIITKGHILFSQDFGDLADMIGRGKSRNVDEHTTDILSHAEDKFYSEIKDDMLIFPAGKLGQHKYKGSIDQILLLIIYSISQLPY